MSKRKLRAKCLHDPAWKYTRQNLHGQQFGRWTAITFVRHLGHPKWECKCDCGEIGFVASDDLKSGKSKSCGCLHRELLGARRRTHGLSKTPMHLLWRHMRERCSDKNNKSYKHYGGRGIFVCERWLKFENFLSDMGVRPVGMQLDRIDNEGPYSTENCRWATPAENSRNRRSTILITINNRTQCLTDWCQEVGQDYMHVWWKINEKGIDPAIALGVLNG